MTRLLDNLDVDNMSIPSSQVTNFLMQAINVVGEIADEDRAVIDLGTLLIRAGIGLNVRVGSTGSVRVVADDTIDRMVPERLLKNNS